VQVAELFSEAPHRRIYDPDLREKVTESIGPAVKNGFRDKSDALIER
jgi:hypothetical protein